MKKLITLLFIIGFTCQGYAQDKANAEEDFKKITWLVGRWDRTNVKPGRSAFEEWTRVSPTELSGRGITLKEKDTAFVEKLKILIRGNKLYYVADVPGNKEPVYFAITKVTEDEFICENPDHDFPKMIAYKKDGPKLKATISGNGKSFDYHFRTAD